MRRKAILLVALLCAGSSAVAQVGKGDLETAFLGTLDWSNIDSPSDSQSWGTALDAEVGRFLIDRLDLGGELGLSYSDFERGQFSYSIRLGPAVGVHFRTSSRCVPFIRFGAGWTYARFDFGDSGLVDDLTTDGWFARAGGGADLFLTPTVAIKFQAAYTHTDLDEEVASFTLPFFSASTTTIDVRENEVLLSVGLGIFLKGRSTGDAASP